MIKLLPFTILFFLFVTAVNAQNHKFIASCCASKPKETGRCTGSASCSACSNCSRCAHCSNGGSCGACSSYSQPVTYTPKRTITKSQTKAPSKSAGTTSFKSNSYSQKETATKKEAVIKKETITKKEVVTKKAIVTYRSEDMIAVESQNLNLLEGPGGEYELIEILKRNTQLLVIAIDGDWLQVKVMQSGNYGYVNAKHVYKI